MDVADINGDSVPDIIAGAPGELKVKGWGVTAFLQLLVFCTGSRLGQNLSIPDFSLDSEFGHRL